MTLPRYLDIQLVVSTVTLFMGLTLMYGSIPRKLIGTVFNSARKSMGFSYIILPIITYICHFTNFADFNPYHIGAINLTGYFWTSSSVVLTFALLLGVDVRLSNPKVLRSVIYVICFPLILLLAFWWGDESIIKITTISAAIVFTVHNVIRIITFFRLYQGITKSVDNYYSDNIEPYYHWLINSVYYIIVLSLLSGYSAFFGAYPLWLGLVFMFFSLWVYGYIFYSFTKFLFEFVAKMQPITVDSNYVIPEDIPEKPLMNPEAKANISKNLKEWIANKEFKNRGITIQSVSSKIYTNRTYLSTYINTTYNCSFRVWVTHLRLTEAKMLLCDNPSMSIEEVASEVGFASSTSFIHTFRIAEGIPPQKWRTSQLELMKRKAKEAEEQEDEHPVVEI